MSSSLLTALLVVAAAALLAATVAHAHAGHVHTTADGEQVLCNLVIDENAKPGRPFTVPGVDYAALTAKVERKLAENPRVYSSAAYTIIYTGAVASDTKTALAFAAELSGNNFDFSTKVSGNISVSVVEQDLLSTTKLAFASSNSRPGDNYYCPIGTTNTFASCGASSLYRVTTGGNACNPGQVDIKVTINNNAGISWYKGTDGNPGPTQIDMVTVCMHELNHGLGFASAISNNADANTQQGACALACSTTFDAFLRRSGGQQWNPAGTPSFYTSFFTSSDLYFSPTSTNSEFMKIDSPSNFSAGTSGSHWAADITTPPQCLTGDPLNPLNQGTVANFPNCNGLMKGAIGRGNAIHVLGGNTVAAFTAMGYTLRNCANFTDCGTCLTRGCEWCYSDSKCGDRTNGVDTCSDKNQWVRKSASCASGNLVCSNPSLSVPTNLNVALDPQTLTLQCPASTLDSALGQVVF